MPRALLLPLALALITPAVGGSGAASPGRSTPCAQRFSRIQGPEFPYDDNGNLTDDGSRVLVWDAFNRLVGVAQKSDGAPVAAYFYLPDGRRSRKVVYSQSNPGVVASEVRSAWDGAQEVEEQSATGVTEATYVWSPVYVDELVEFRREAAHPLGAGSFYAHQDARCDVVAVTDGSGQVVEKRRYDDFGREEIRDASGAVVAASPSGLEYGFQGRRRDQETGWVYFRARFYDPEVGRFLSRDPVWDAGNVGGWYTFAGNGPVSGRDPFGDQAANLVELGIKAKAGDPQAIAQLQKMQRDSLDRGIGGAVVEGVKEAVAPGPLRGTLEVAEKTAAGLWNGGVVGGLYEWAKETRDQLGNAPVVTNVVGLYRNLAEGGPGSGWSAAAHAGELALLGLVGRSTWKASKCPPPHRGQPFAPDEVGPDVVGDFPLELPSLPETPVRTPGSMGFVEYALEGYPARAEGGMGGATRVVLQDKGGGQIYVQQVATSSPPALPKGSGASLLAEAIRGEGAQGGIASVSGTTQTPGVVANTFWNAISGLGKNPGTPEVVDLGGATRVTVPVLPSPQPRR